MDEVETTSVAEREEENLTDEATEGVDTIMVADREEGDLIGEDHMEVGGGFGREGTHDFDDR